SSCLAALMQLLALLCLICFFFVNAIAPPALYTLSLHDALPISFNSPASGGGGGGGALRMFSRIHLPRLTGEVRVGFDVTVSTVRSEEHTSELQSLAYLVCRLLLEKKNKTQYSNSTLLCATINDL